MDTQTSPLALLQDPSLLKTDALIGGDWLAGTARFEVSDPATGQRLADVANLGAADAETAIAAANSSLLDVEQVTASGATRANPQQVVVAPGLQTRQQLAVQALSLASRSDQAILRLF